MFYDADIDSFLDTDEFARSAVYTHSGVSSTISVIFDLPGTILTIGRATLILDVPTALCKSTDVASIARNDTMVINGTTYYVKTFEPDGTGITKVTFGKGLA